jgi:transcriptional regulator with XRE-family HTH domain
MGHKQKDIVKVLSISKSTVSEWGNEGKNPRIENLKKMCDILECTADSLMDNQETIDHNVCPETEQSAEDKERADYINILADNIGQLSTKRLIEAIEMVKIWLKNDSQDSG